MYTSVAHGKIILACEEGRKVDLANCRVRFGYWQSDSPGGRRMNWYDQECFDTGCKCEGCLELQHLEEEE